MINLSTIYAGQANESDKVRYSKPSDPSEIRPIVVMNLTKRCNLRCIHCYSNSNTEKADGELTTEQVITVLEDLAAYGVKHVLFSGGEPLTRGDIFELAHHAKSLGLRVTLSTNGTLITPRIAHKISDAGFAYVGISFDGLGAVNDHFRGAEGAFVQARRGLHHLIPFGVRVGLRLTLTRHTVDNLDDVLKFVEDEPIRRACFYHLAYSGRGGEIRPYDLSLPKRREALDKLCRAALNFAERGLEKEILTVDNHSDGPYVFLKLLHENPVRAQEVLKILTRHGGAVTSSGVGLAEIDWNGKVHPDQFSMFRTIGDVTVTPFSKIWSDPPDPFHQGLRNRLKLLKGRCSGCKFLGMCGGGLRARAEMAHGDPWESDPACLLTDDEIRPAAPQACPYREGPGALLCTADGLMVPSIEDRQRYCEGDFTACPYATGADLMSLMKGPSR